MKRHNEIRDHNSKVYSPDPEEKVTSLCYVTTMLVAVISDGMHGRLHYDHID